MRTKKSLLIALSYFFMITACGPPPEITSAKVYITQDRNTIRTENQDDFSATNNSEKRIIIFTANIDIETNTPDSVHHAVSNLAKKYKGYVLLSSNTKTSIRIPTSSLDDVLKDVETFGIVTNKNIKGSDVTSEYRDYEIRLDNAEKSRHRYLELLEMAESVQSALNVEKELERLNKELDLLKGELNRLSHLAKFSTIHVSTKPHITPGPLGYVLLGFYKVVEKLFVWNY